MTPSSPAEPWLPDFCRLPRVAVLMGVSELAVIVLVLAPDGGTTWTPERVLTASGFAMWLALTVAVMLCGLRRPLAGLAPSIGTAAALAATALATGVAAGVLYLIGSNVGADWVPADIGAGRFVVGAAGVMTLIVAVVLRYLYVNDRWQAQVRASARAEADALQARIRPHFLFNSMNTIAVLVRRDAALAERALLDLSDLFRAALHAGGASTLAEEVELTERYLAIESLRLGDRMQVAWERIEPLPWQLPMPRLVLQPLAENAVLHGVSRATAGGTVRIEMRVEGAVLRIVLTNPAPPGTSAVRGTGHGQFNIRQRLLHAFGPGARVEGFAQDDTYRCEVRLPLGAPRPA